VGGKGKKDLMVLLFLIHFYRFLALPSPSLSLCKDRTPYLQPASLYLSASTFILLPSAFLTRWEDRRREEGKATPKVKNV
jgi:hypothetical protein